MRSLTETLIRVGSMRARFAEVEDQACRVSGLDPIQLPLKHEAHGEIEFAR